MAAPITNEQGLIDYCLRRLGAPVITINVDEQQLSDRIQDALNYYTRFHFEGSQRTYISHKITGSHLQFTTNAASNFNPKDVVTCNTSGATFIVHDAPELNKVRTKKFTGNSNPIVGETVTITSGVNTGFTATIAPSGVFIGDIQNQYIILPDEILSVLRTLPFNVDNRAGDNYIFDATYQIMLSDIFNYKYADLTYYTTIQQHLSLLDFTLNAKQSVDFSRVTSKLKLPDNVWQTINIDQYLVLECYTSIVDGQDSKVYDEQWVKNYATALIQRQFAKNLGKFSNIILPGGVTLNSERMEADADREIEKLEKQLIDQYSEPLGLFIG